MSKHVVFFGDPAGTRTPDLRLKRAASIVIQRFATCKKVAILAGFSCFAFYSVLQNNSTFCNGVEFLLNYFSVYFRDKYSPASRACARVFYASIFFYFLPLSHTLSGSSCMVQSVGAALVHEILTILFQRSFFMFCISLHFCLARVRARI